MDQDRELIKCRILNQVKTKDAAIHTLMLETDMLTRTGVKRYRYYTTYADSKHQLFIEFRKAFGVSDDCFEVIFSDDNGDATSRPADLAGDLSKRSLFKREYFEERVTVNTGRITFSLFSYSLKNNEYQFEICDETKVSSIEFLLGPLAFENTSTSAISSYMREKHFCSSLRSEGRDKSNVVYVDYHFSKEDSDKILTECRAFGVDPVMTRMILHIFGAAYLSQEKSTMEQIITALADISRYSNLTV